LSRPLKNFIFLIDTVVIATESTGFVCEGARKAYKRQGWVERDIFEKPSPEIK